MIQVRPLGDSRLMNVGGWGHDEAWTCSLRGIVLYPTQGELRAVMSW